MSQARTSDRTSGAFFMSVILHGSVVAIMFMYAYATGFFAEEKPKVFELVAGAGDNYMATEAPALGSPGGNLGRMFKRAGHDPGSSSSRRCCQIERGRIRISP